MITGRSLCLSLGPTTPARLAVAFSRAHVVVRHGLCHVAVLSDGLRQWRWARPQGAFGSVCGTNRPDHHTVAVSEVGAAPSRIEVSRSNGISVTFEDGSTVVAAASTLRENCPCADCRGRRSGGGTVTSDGVTIADAELHGALGIALSWSDGHSTGIHSWELIRTLGAGS